MNIAQLADKLYQEFENKTFKRPVYDENGNVRSEEEESRIVIRNKGEYNQEVVNLVYAVNDMRMAIDYAYSYTCLALGYISEVELDNWDDEDAVDEAIMEVRDKFEPDVYTSGLTEWLDASNSHVYYLNDVLIEFAPTDGFALLGLAQAKHFEEVFDKVLEEIKKLLEV